MSKSEVVEAVGWIQRELKPLLKEHGFRTRGRTCNRLTSDGLTQVVNFQTARADPPGTPSIPRFRENMYGLFTVNLGVYVPEVGEVRRLKAGSWVQEYDCAIRERLDRARGETGSFWWCAKQDATVCDDLHKSLVKFGFPFLDRFATRDLILAELDGAAQNLEHCATPRIVSAIILAGRDEPERARDLLAAQAHEFKDHRHPEYVRELAARMGLGSL